MDQLKKQPVKVEKTAEKKDAVVPGSFRKQQTEKQQAKAGTAEGCSIRN